MTALIGGILLAAGVMLYLLEPVFSGRGAPSFAGDDDHDEGATRRRAALTALRDLEYDRMTGKLDGKDYELLKGELSRDALRQLGPHPDGGGSDPRIERADRALEEEIAQLRKALREGLRCAGCDHVNRTGARFCGRCGQRLDPSQSPPGDSTASVAAGAGRQPVDKIPPAFERRCIRAGSPRSSLLLGGTSVPFPLQSALPARRLAALGARAD